MSIYGWELVWYQSRKGQVKIVMTISESQINPAGGKRAHMQWSKYYMCAMKQRQSCRGFTYYSIYECYILHWSKIRETDH